MAERTVKVVYRNATIDTNDWTLTEYTDVSIRTYNIRDILEQFNGRDHVTLKISVEEDW